MTKFAIMPASYFDGRLSHRQLRIMGALLSFADKDGLCWPKRERVSEITNIRESTITLETKALVKLGFLKKTGNGGRSNSCDYEIQTVPETGRLTVPDSSKTVLETGRMAEETVPELSRILPELSTRIEQTIELTSKESKPKKNLADGFDEFWKSYPMRKQNKKGCLAKWKKNKLHLIADQILQNVIDRSKHDGNWLRGFAPSTSTYLNQERWDDDWSKENGKTQQQQWAEEVAEIDAQVQAARSPGTGEVYQGSTERAV